MMRLPCETGRAFLAKIETPETCLALKLSSRQRQNGASGIVAFLDDA
jgi:hypothetical protein